MQLLARVFFLAVCVIGAMAWPSSHHSVPQDVGEVNGIYRLLSAQSRPEKIDSRAPTPGEISCYNAYNNRTQQINQQLTNQTNLCFDNANKTRIAIGANLNATTNEIRLKTNKIQSQLQNCSLQATNEQFLQCTNANFDSNLLLLNEANSQAYLAQAQLWTNQSQVDIQRQACVNVAISGAKTNLTQAANDYDACLMMAKNQRTMNEAHLIA